MSPLDLEDDRGPFDIIGDIHGCADELQELLDELGYDVFDDELERQLDPPRAKGRRVIFLGDLCDRGPANIRVLEIVFAMIDSGDALWIRGNHDRKLWRYLTGKTGSTYYGMTTTLEELSLGPNNHHPAIDEFCRMYERHSTEHLVLDEGRLVVAHGGLTEELHGKSNSDARQEAVYGPENDVVNLGGEIRWRSWVEAYKGKAAVVYGHCHTEKAEWINNTICLDTDCVFGKQLTALRWPKREIVQVQARKVYWI